MRHGWTLARRAALAALLCPSLLLAQDVKVSGGYFGGNGHLAAGDGRFSAIWDGQDPGICSGASEPEARAIDATGTFLSARVPVTENCAGADQWPDVGLLPSGVSLAAFPRGDVYVRLFDPAMLPLGPELMISTDVPVSLPNREVSVAAVGTDRFAVVWQNMGVGVYGRIVMADGSLPAPPVLLATTGTYNWPLVPRVAAFGNGEVVVAWCRGASGCDVFVRVFDQALQPVGPELQANQAATAWYYLDVDAEGDRYAVIWESYQGAGPSDVLLRFFDRVAGPLGNEQRANETAGFAGVGAVAVDAAGRSVVYWNSAHTGQLRPYGRRFDANGAPMTGEFRLAVDDWGNGGGDVAMFPSGDFLASYLGGVGGHTLMRRFFFPVSLALAPGPGSGNAPRLAVRRPDGSLGYPELVPFGSGGYGAQVGAGDIDGDGLSEVLAGPGPSPSYGPQVRAFERDGAPIAKVNFYAYGTLRYGVKPKALDLDGDGIEEILTTPGPGSPFGPHVRAFDFDGGPLSSIAKVSFFAFSTLQWGANGDGAELDADGFDEILAAPGPGPAFGAQVKGFDYDNTSVRAMGKVNFYAFSTSTHGATIASADVESNGIGGYRDGYDEIAAGHGPGVAHDGEIRLFDFDADAMSQKHAEPPPYAWLYGIELAGGDVDAGDSDEVVTAPGPDPAAASRVLVWDWSSIPGRPTDLAPIGPDDFTGFPGGYGGHVAVGRFE